MNIALGADHAGFALKERVKQALEAEGHRVFDAGTASAESVDYPDFAAAVAHRVVRGEAQRGILVCGTGAGMAISANKIHGVRAASAASVEEARLIRRHNNANVLTLGARLVGETRALEVVHAWLDAEFEGGRHQRRVDKIAELERNGA